MPCSVLNMVPYMMTITLLNKCDKIFAFLTKLISLMKVYRTALKMLHVEIFFFQ